MAVALGAVNLRPSFGFPKMEDHEQNAAARDAGARALFRPRIPTIPWCDHLVSLNCHGPTMGSTPL